MADGDQKMRNKASIFVPIHLEPEPPSFQNKAMHRYQSKWLHTSTIDVCPQYLTKIGAVWSMPLKRSS